MVTTVYQYDMHFYYFYFSFFLLQFFFPNTFSLHVLFTPFSLFFLLASYYFSIFSVYPPLPAAPHHRSLFPLASTLNLVHVIHSSTRSLCYEFSSATFHRPRSPMHAKRSVRLSKTAHLLPLTLAENFAVPPVVVLTANANWIEKEEKSGSGRGEEARQRDRIGKTSDFYKLTLSPCFSPSSDAIFGSSRPAVVEA